MTRIRLVVACLVIFAALGVTIYWLSGWSRINCWTHEINISTGHQRYTRYWFWCITERRVTPTWVSDSLGHSAALAEANPDWRLVVTLSHRIGHSPHYAFHSALHDLRQAETALAMIEVTPAARTKLASATVWLWKLFDSDYEAGSFLLQVLMSDPVAKREHLTEADIPSLHSWLTALRARLAEDDGNAPYLEPYDRALEALSAQSAPTP